MGFQSDQSAGDFAPLLPEYELRELQSDDEESEHDDHNFARAAPGEKTVQPCEDHPVEKQVHQNGSAQHENGPPREVRPRDANPDAEADMPEDAGQSDRIGEAIAHGQRKKNRKAQRKTQKTGDVKIRRELRGHDGEELPKECKSPDDDLEDHRFGILRDEITRQD